ncbi:MAG TPA: YciI family protein [Verrucomicrobiae bacterium]|nr:YciI family protein [Verrucomicrobiae bacterium]
MSTTPTAKSDYMLLFRGNDWDKDLSPEQLQRVVSDWAAWFERLTQQGKAIGGHPLRAEGKLVSGRKGRTVADGPFVESKEAIGGYFYLQVADENEAVAIAQQCPGLEYGAVVEVRPVAEMCTVRARALETSSPAEQLAVATT